jgi:hypothetical protein
MTNIVIVRPLIILEDKKWQFLVEKSRFLASTSEY